MLSSVDKIYASPLIRTLQTAKAISDKFSLEINIDDRIREINWGIFDGQANNEEIDAVREKQTGGDFFIRFGKYGENKFDIESRLCDFLTSVTHDNFSNNKIAIVSHGTVILFMKRILNVKSSHAKKGKFEKFENVDFSNVRKYQKMLANVREREIAKRIKTEKI